MRRSTSVGMSSPPILCGSDKLPQNVPHAGVVLRVAHAGLQALRLAVGHALPAAALALLDALR